MLVRQQTRLVEPCEPCGRRRWPAARAAGRCAWRCGGAGYARTHLEVPGGPLDALRRRGTRLRLAAARHGTGGPRHCGRRYRSTVTAGHGAPASAMMIAPAAFHDPVAARVAAQHDRASAASAADGQTRQARPAGAPHADHQSSVPSSQEHGQQRERAAVHTGPAAASDKRWHHYSRDGGTHGLCRRCAAWQHVHPLKACYQQPVELPPWGQVYADATLPLHLDIGCGYGALHQHGLRPTFCP